MWEASDGTLEGQSSEILIDGLGVRGRLSSSLDSLPEAGKDMIMITTEN